MSVKRLSAYFLVFWGAFVTFIALQILALAYVNDGAVTLYFNKLGEMQLELFCGFTLAGVMPYGLYAADTLLNSE